MLPNTIVVLLKGITHDLLNKGIKHDNYSS